VLESCTAEEQHARNAGDAIGGGNAGTIPAILSKEDQMTVTSTEYGSWLKKVEEVLISINMRMDDWQKTWRFDFRREFEAGANANDAAAKANRHWWHQQNKAIGQDCRKAPGCWLPRDHQGDCEPGS